MSVIALGLNHSTAPLDLRGRFAFAPEQLGGALHGLRERIGSRARPEAALLSTCNRTELYFATGAGRSHDLVRPAIDWLAAYGSTSGEHVQAHTYVLEDRAAARHAFRVASGLDSMVLGEPQILGQMKEAVRQAETAGTLGSTLHQLFQRSFSVARRCAAPPKSAAIRSAWPPPRCGWPGSCSRTWAASACSSSAPAR